MKSTTSHIILGIESSCDETAAAVLHVETNEQGQEQLTLLSNIVASQVKLHARYGGVVPELASRAHLKNGIPVIREALERAEVTQEDVDAIAVTASPGLVGALLVGVQLAKSLSFVWDKPLVGVNHLEGHLQAVYLEEGQAPTFPFIALLVSGGHTTLYRVDGHRSIKLLGATRDDAAGEAFDKAAKMLGLPYPGGVYIDRLSQTGDAKRFDFPRAMLSKGLDFSFSGLKTACRNTIQAREEAFEGQDLSDLCASYQEAIVDVLWKKSLKALRQEGCDQLVVTGGVAANSRLRSLFQECAERENASVFLPSRAMCTDNAAMIACAGLRRIQDGESDGFELNASGRVPMGGYKKPKQPKKKSA